MTGGKSEVEIEGQTVGQIIENLGAAHPGLKERLYDEKGDVRRFINIYVNEEDIRFLTGTDTPLKDGDEVSIIPAIAGGA
jgi:molybdopterin synthase sulfur carrier subunit